MNMKKLIILGITLGLILTSLISGCLDGENGENGEELEPAPDFTLTSIDNDTFKLSDFEGKVVVLDFMYVACQYCDDEMEHLKEIYSNYGSNQVVIITIDILDTDTEQDLRNFKDQYGDDWIYALDTDNVKTKYGVSPVPMIVIVDKEGNIAFEKVGYDESDYETLSSEIDELL